MRRETHDELWSRLEKAHVSAPCGKVIRHVKSGDLYRIRAHSLRESDLEVLTSYSPGNRPGVLFSRPLADVRARFVYVETGEWPTEEH